MLRTSLLLLAFVACSGGSDSAADAPDLRAWAERAAIQLSEPRACSGLEQEHFGAIGTSVCWGGKARREQPPAGSRMFPRFTLELATYADEAAAQQRLARFRELPGVDGELRKTYPLRAGFRLGARVMIVTTDAYAFEADIRRVAAELARELGGTDVVCWRDC